MTEQLTHPEVKTHLGDSGGIMSLQLTCKLHLPCLNKAGAEGQHTRTRVSSTLRGVLHGLLRNSTSLVEKRGKDVDQRNGMTWCLWEVRPEPQENSHDLRGSSTAEATGPSILMKQWNISLKCRTHPTQVKVPHSAGLLHWT